MTQPLSVGQSRALLPAWASPLAWVYRGVTTDLAAGEAAVAIRTVTPDWGSQDHLDVALGQHALAMSLADQPDSQAKADACVAAAFMHFAAAGVDPLDCLMPAELGKSLAKARSHKYISRERKGDKWIYTYPDDPKADTGSHPEAANQAQSPASVPAGAPAHAGVGTPRGDAYAAAAKVADAKAAGGAASSKHAAKWKGLEAAEADGTAETALSAATLLDAHPVAISRLLYGQKPLTAVATSLALASFPEKVPYKSGDSEAEKAERRKDYAKAFESLRSMAAQFDGSEGHSIAIRALHNAVDKEITRLTDKDKTDPLAAQLKAMVTKKWFGSSDKSLESIVGALSDASSKVSGGAQNVRDFQARAGHAFLEHGKITEPQSETRQVTRLGPKIANIATLADQKHVLSKTMGVRGIKVSKNLTPAEHEHHMRNLAESFTDLASVLGLPAEMCSFNGRLGLNVGATGLGDAAAHYTSKNREITLSRADGVGSLAHEWGHFFDNIVGGLVGGGRDSFATEMADEKSAPSLPHADAGILKAFGDVVHKNPAMQAFAARYRKSPEYKKLTAKQKIYYDSTTERWARCFESYVGHKLVAKGQTNSYLYGKRNDPFWPTDDETKKMAPAFDTVIAEAKKTGLMKKAMAALVAERKALSKSGLPGAPRIAVPRKPAQIGTTRSGKAIYDSYNHPAHKDFDGKDWVDAGRAARAGTVHLANVAARKKGAMAKGPKPLGAAFSHARKVAAKTGGGKAKEKAVALRYLTANGHGKMAKATSGEGSRGGHVVGHSKTTGKPIYGDSATHVASYGKPATEEEAKRVIHGYKNFGYVGINEAARNYDQKPKTKAHVDFRRAADVLSQKIAADRLPRDTVLYRGMALPKETKVGDIISTHGFTSASMGKSVAQRFAAKAGERRSGGEVTHASVVATIHAKKGTPVLDMDKHTDSAVDGEKERLFDHRVRFRVVADHGTGKGGHRNLVLEPILPEDGQTPPAKSVGHQNTSVEKSMFGHNSEVIGYTQAGEAVYAAQPAEAMNKADGVDILKDFLCKAGGEGSRGGKVIGHTKGSGKPIYAKTHAGHPKYSQFSADDHKEAAAIHSAESQKHLSRHNRALKYANTEKEAASAQNAAQYHHEKAQEHDVRAHNLQSSNYSKSQPSIAETWNTGLPVMWASADDQLSKAGGEGSRGGKVIGHTRAGKPVYAASHPAYKNVAHKNFDDFTGDENAANVHASTHHAGWTAADHQDASEIHDKHRGSSKKAEAVSHAHYGASEYQSSIDSEKTAKKSMGTPFWNTGLPVMWAPIDRASRSLNN